MCDLYTEDAVVPLSDRDVRGREEITRLFAHTDSSVHNISHSMMSRELTIHDSIGLDLGTFTHVYRVGDGPEQTVSGTYLATWRLGIDGHWRMRYDMAFVPTTP